MERSEAIRRLGTIAPDQWGLVTTRQAQDAGLSRVDLTRLIDAELLLRAAHGVYQLAGGTPTAHLDIKAAWLRLDPAIPAWQRPQDGPRAAVVSFSSACRLYDIGDIPADNVEISVPVRRTTRENGVVLHKVAVPADDITIVDGLPVTTVDRTICDLLRNRADGGHIGRVLAEADQRGLTDTRELAGRVQPYARAYGLPKDGSGADLLNFLAEEAGYTLRDEQLNSAGVRTAAAYHDALLDTSAPILTAFEAMAAYGDLATDHRAALVLAQGAESVRRVMEQVGHMRLDVIQAAAAHTGALQRDVLAEIFAKTAAASPGRLAAAQVAELVREASAAAQLAQTARKALPAPELAPAEPESEDEDTGGTTSGSG
ncbi:type IV toxin-antitoxin system AbiEi family antitoxin domain-containing protein [Streptomyces sp. NPDC054952]